LIILDLIKRYLWVKIIYYAVVIFNMHEKGTYILYLFLANSLNPSNSYVISFFSKRFWLKISYRIVLPLFIYFNTYFIFRVDIIFPLKLIRNMCFIFRVGIIFPLKLYISLYRFSIFVEVNFKLRSSLIRVYLNGFWLAIVFPWLLLLC